MNLEIEPVDPRLGLRGLSELAAEGDWWRPSRLPLAGGSYLHPDLRQMSDMPAGGVLRFFTDASELELSACVTLPGPMDFDPAPYDPTPSPFDVFVEDELVARETLSGEGTIRVSLPGTRVAVAVWLPHFATTLLGRVRLRDVDVLEAAAPQTTRWIAYGSSITHCRDVPGPSETWPALVGRARGWEVVNLGFAGQCLLDPAVARYIRDCDADGISVCLGINVFGRHSFYERTLLPAIIGFLETIRDGHPTTPLFVCSPIASPARELLSNGAGLRLAQIRQIVEQSAGVLQAAGDANLHVVNGLDLIGSGDSDLLPDGLHPGPEGYRQLAERLGRRLHVRSAGTS